MASVSRLWKSRKAKPAFQLSHSLNYYELLIGYGIRILRARSTQILLDEDKGWVGREKSVYLCELLKGHGWECTSEVTKINWDWRSECGGATTAFLGLHDFDCRRVAFAAGYEWLLDAGISTSFLEPRVSWHSLPSDLALAKSIFPSDVSHTEIEIPPDLHERLKNTPGQCGVFRFRSANASAPSMGLIAAALLWNEARGHFGNMSVAVKGSLGIWSPILPPLEDRG